MGGVKRKRTVLNVKQKSEILPASTDAEDVLNEGNSISHSAALQSVETLLDYMGQRGFDYGDITAVPRYMYCGLSTVHLQILPVCGCSWAFCLSRHGQERRMYSSEYQYSSETLRPLDDFTPERGVRQ
ncbi:hypothetical protein AVEN_118563-1 [Araneus ventricosus]|uniref:Uncharacterized protein n=1 Tax=Araneus ventricosus TaxID=182803 RepID=A0A4Y2AVR0_ARAVE|nr:hypothetical protein AVEN_118563-1 [Araneus ventricosus]